LTTGSNHSGPARQTGLSAKASRAFTLLELLLVLIVVSAVLAITSPSLRGFFASRQTADAAMRIVALTQWAHSQAISNGQHCRLNTDGRAVWLTVQHGPDFVQADGENGRQYMLPEGASVRFVLQTADPTQTYVEFHPTGRSDQAVIEVIGRDGERFLVVCDAPTDPFRVLSPREAAGR